MDHSPVAPPVGLLERDREIDRVRDLLRAVGRRAGAVVVVEGAAGIGKSQLLETARSRADELGLRVLSARATELEQGFPFGVVRQLFERALLEAPSDERERWLAGAAALAGEVLTEAPPASPMDGGAGGGDPGYAWQHGLYWLASNIALDRPLVLLVDDMQWCDAPSARALAFISRRLSGQPLGVIMATRPLDPALMPELATLMADPAAERIRPAPLSEAATHVLIGSRLSAEPIQPFVRACLEVTGGNPFLLGELLDEAAARGLKPTAATAVDVGAIVPRGVANAVLLRLARLPPPASDLARALSVLGDGAQVGDAARLAEVDGTDVETAMGLLVSAGVMESGGTVRFTHPILRSAIYGDLTSAHRERLHHAAARILRQRGAPPSQVATHVMYTEPRADPDTVELLRSAAREALSLGDARGAAALLARALKEPPAAGARDDVVLELGLARARMGAPDAIAPLSEIVAHGREQSAIVAAGIELSGMLFFAGRAAEGAAILRQARERLPAAAHGREQLDVALLGVAYTSVASRREAEVMIAGLRDPGGEPTSRLQSTTLAALAMDEVMNSRSAAKAIDLARRALATTLPPEPHRGENWAIVAIGAQIASDDLDSALRATDEILARARRRGSVLTVATISALRAVVCLRRGELVAAAADAQEAIDLVPELLGAEYISLGVSAAVLAGLERDETPDALRRLLDQSGVSYETDFMPSSQLRYASAVLRAAAGNHEAAVEELSRCELDHPGFGGENPAVVAWRSSAALSLAELGRHDEARALAVEEVRRAKSFGARRAIGIALRAQALVGPPSERAGRLAEALGVLAPSPARLEHARVLVDVGATLRASGQRASAREPLLEGLALAARCGARTLERRARAELTAIGVRPRNTDRSGVDSLTPSERRVVELAAGGGTNREIAQTLFVTEKTVETHLGRAFRKLDVSSRRQLRDVLGEGSD